MKRFKTKILIAIVALAVLLTTNVTFAWFSLSKNSLSPQINGGVIEEYFHCGDGSEDNPFVITRPAHYYHMVEFFQRTTALPLSDEQAAAKTALFGKDYLYFQIGYRLDDTSEEFFVYDYNDDGTYIVENGKPKTSSSLNMNCYSEERALMPLGSSEVPFFGFINGNGLEVKNLHIVSNSTVNVKKTDTEEIISVDRTTSDIGVFGYVGKGTDENKTTIKNIYFSDVDIDLSGLEIGGDGFKNETSEEHDDSQHKKADSEEKTAYVGYLAGHVYTTTNINSVYVNNCSFSGGAEAKDGFGMFGCVNKPDGTEAEALGEYVKKLSSGDGNDWGGSIDMEELFNRAVYFYTNSVATDGSQGSFKYGSYSNPEDGEGLIGLNGGSKFKDRVGDNKTDKVTGEEDFYIYNGSNYLSISSSEVINATSQAGAVTWSFSQEGYLFAYRDDEKCYLNCNSFGRQLQLSNSPSTVWILEKNNSAYTIKWNYWTHPTSGILYYTYIYLKSSGNNLSWAADPNSTPTVSLSENSENKRRVLFTSGCTFVDDNGNCTATYIPLKVDADKNATADNTGYILSGCDNLPEGDIRLRRQWVWSSLSNSIKFSSTDKKYGDGKNMTIYTYTASGFSTIEDEPYNSVAKGNKLGLKRYGDTKPKFDALLNGKDYVYGMHFMSASISTNKIVTVPKAKIIGGEKNGYTNYQMPADSIDFKVSDKGMITFFAGTFYGSDANFFSLHQIIRNPDNVNEIAEIKEISKIYTQAGNKSYVYLYKDGNYSDTMIKDIPLTLVFDCNWITNPTIILKAVYYIEIPVNAGEYALGSSGSGNGAYLLYLDIGANGGKASADIGKKDGHTLSDTFKNIDYRSREDVSESALMQFSVIAPQGTKQNFFLKVEFDGNAADCDGYGIYKIYVKNCTDANIELLVCMFDDDGISDNEYKYGYQIIYCNEAGEETPYKNGEKNYFQTVNKFIIGSDGVSIEQNSG